MENRKSYLLFSSEMWSGGFVILNMYFYLLRYSYFRNVFLLSILEPGTVWIRNFYHLRNSKKSIVRSGHGYEPHSPWLMYLFTLYKLWRNTLGNSLMNIQLKKSDIEILNKNKDSCENMQFVLGREMKWNPKWIFCLRDKLSVSTPSTALNRYRLLLRRYFGFTSTKSNPFAKNEISLQTLDIKSRKSRLPCQLSASTGIGESSPRYHLSSLSSPGDKVIVISKESRVSSESQCIDV